MAGNIIDAGKDDAPISAGGLSENFGIEQIPGANQKTRDCYTDAKSISDPKKLESLVTKREKVERRENPDGSAMARQSAFPDVQNADRIGEINLRLVKQRVSEAGPDNRSDHHVENQIVDVDQFDFFSDEHGLGQVKARREGHRKQDSVPTKSDRSQMQKLWGNIPDNGGHVGLIVARLLASRERKLHRITVGGVTMRKRKPQIDEAINSAGSLEQQLDMCVGGSLRGDEQLREYHDHPLFEEDMAEEDREGDEMSGDDHSNGLQGGEAGDESQEFSSGMPGDETRVEELKAKNRHLPEEPEPTEEARVYRFAQGARRRTG